MAEVDRRIRFGIGLTVVSVLALSLTTDLSFWEALGLGLFYLLLPSLAVAQLPLLKTTEIERVPVYLGSAATILVIGALATGLGLASGSLADLGLSWTSGTQTITWALAATATGLALIGATWPIERRGPDGSGDFVLRLIPRTRREKRLFVSLSVAAGLGEEVAYRGYALSAIQLLVPGAWTAACLSSVAFGVLHAYQGPVGVFRTALIGLALAVPVLMTGSLVPGIIAHALIDVIAGLLVGPRMVTKAKGQQSDRSGLDPLEKGSV